MTSIRAGKTFVGRKAELAKLEHLLASPDAQIGVIYGRRRIGKSMLIRHALQDRPALMLDGLEGESTQRQIRYFSDQLQTAAGAKLPHVRTWSDALRQLHSAVRDDPQPIGLDEFQWLANYRHHLVAVLKSIWDNRLSLLPAQKLILCGSVPSFMIENVMNSSALYGRILMELEVRPFQLADTQEMLAGRGIDEILQAQLLTGGIPQYLRLLSTAPSIQLGLQALAFQQDGYLVREYERIFTSHFGRNPDFAAIVHALAEKPVGLMREDLAANAGLSLGGQLSEHLRDLESAGFISAERPFHRRRDSREVRYRLSDGYLRFYFAFIRPNLEKIQSGLGANTLSGLSGSSALASWMGHAFEQTCMQHAPEIAQLLGFSAVDYEGPYFLSHRPETQGTGAALVFDRADNVLTVCEMKYSSQPAGVEAIADMQRQIALLQPVTPNNMIQPVLIVHPCASRDVLNAGYFYKVIEARQLMKRLDSAGSPRGSPGADQQLA